MTLECPALALLDSSLPSEERMWVPVDAVHGLGEHSVTINAEADVRARADAPEAGTLVKAGRGVIGNKAVMRLDETASINEANMNRDAAG